MQNGFTRQAAGKEENNSSWSFWMQTLQVLKCEQVVGIQKGNLRFVEDERSETREEYGCLVQLVNSEGCAGISPVVACKTSSKNNTQRFLVSGDSIKQIWHVTSGTPNYANMFRLLAETDGHVVYLDGVQ